MILNVSQCSKPQLKVLAEIIELKSPMKMKKIEDEDKIHLPIIHLRNDFWKIIV